MSPPSFADLGKNARDIFSKGFHFGLFKVNVKTTTSNNIDFNTGAQSHHDTGLFSGTLETKYKWKEYGTTIKETWSTDNNLGFDLSIEDRLLEGIKLGINGKFNINTGQKSGRVKSEYRTDVVNTSVDLDVFSHKIMAALVLGDKGFMGGVQIGSDALKSDKSVLASSNVALGYMKDDLEVHVGVKNCTEYVGSVYQKVFKELETGIHLSWLSGSGETAFGFGGKYNVDKDTAFKVKIDNSSRVGLSYEQKLRAGVTLTLSSLLEGRSLSAGGHKFGLALDFQA